MQLCATKYSFVKIKRTASYSNKIFNVHYAHKTTCQQHTRRRVLKNIMKPSVFFWYEKKLLLSMNETRKEKAPIEETKRRPKMV